MEIYDCTPYKLLLRIISDLWASSHMVRSVFLMAPDRCAESLEEHRLILEALRAGKGKAAGQLVGPWVSSWPGPIVRWFASWGKVLPCTVSRDSGRPLTMTYRSPILSATTAATESSSSFWSIIIILPLGSRIARAITSG